jgi:hypothetical protein
MTGRDVSSLAGPETDLTRIFEQILWLRDDLAIDAE